MLLSPVNNPSFKGVALEDMMFSFLANLAIVIAIPDSCCIDLGRTWRFTGLGVR